jgi:hypothetical protein
MAYPLRSAAPAALAMLLGLNIAAAGTLLAQTKPDPNAGPRTEGVVTNGTAQKPPLKLSDAQKQQILQAVATQNTLDKPPEGFTPQPGVKVPSQEKLPLHPLPPDLVQKLPDLKEYEYAKLEHSVVIVDPMAQQVVEVIQE